MVRYASKCAWLSLSDKTFLRIQCSRTYNLKSSGHMWKFTIFNDFYVIQDILCVVQSCTRDPTGELQSETRIGRSLIRHCVRCKYVHTSLFGMQLCLTAKLTYLMTAFMLYALNGGFTANHALFYNKKVAKLHDTLQRLFN